jgi:hypothetical protein
MSRPRSGPSVSCQSCSTADTELRADVYRSLGITLAYRREDRAKCMKVQAALKGVDLERVGGGTSTPSTRAPWRGQYLAA